MLTASVSFVVEPPLAYAQRSVTTETSDEWTRAEIEDLKAGVVQITATIQGLQKVGTGIVVTKQKDSVFILTAAHVVEGSTQVKVTFYTKRHKMFAARILGLEGGESNGLAALIVEGEIPSGLRTFALNQSLELSGGEKVLIIGFPRLAGTSWMVTNGVIGAKKGTIYIFSGSFDAGNSGGPLIIKDKAVGISTVGIITNKLGQFGYAAPIMSTLFALQSWGIRVGKESTLISPEVQSSQDPSNNPKKSRLVEPIKNLIGKDVRSDARCLALLIGIEKYPKKGFYFSSIIPGVKNDIESLSRLLQTRYGFAEDHIRLLIDEDATRSKILQALQQLVRDAGHNDVVFIYFSGHGSQTKDLNGDEYDDQLDETIVPYDGRLEGSHDITDDELAEIFAQFKTTNAIVVLDSGRSGGSTSGYPFIDPMMFGSYILMTATPSYDPGLNNGPIEGRYRSLFLYSLTKSLQSLSKTASVLQIYAGLKQELLRLGDLFGRKTMPEPQIQGPTSRLDKPLLPGQCRHVSTR